MIGQTISHYKITEKLGEGGMGVVYKAEDTKLERPVALKFLAAHAVEDPEHKARFVREAKAAARLDHQNICPVHEIDEADGHTFLAMAYLEGRTVKDEIAERPLKLDQALDIAVQTAQGLQAAHEKDIVHRDIKSANLMVTPQGQVKIMDFGLAQLTERSKLTETTTILGTPSYMSPEQAVGEKTDRRTDLWSQGVVLYEMVTGRLPFEGERQEAVLFGISNQEPEPVTALRAGLPMELEWIVGKALEKDPGERYQHAEDLLVDLRSLQRKLAAGKSTISRVRIATGTSTDPAVESSGHTRQRKQTLAFGVGALGLILALVFALLWVSSTNTPVETPLRRYAYTPGNLSASGAGIAVSPNGKHIVYTARRGNGKLWVQDLDQEQPRAIEGTEGAFLPFWSPDSDFIAFAIEAELRKVSVQGGPAVRLCEMPGAAFYGGAWSPDGDLVVFSSNPANVFPAIYEVPAQGGVPSLLIGPEESEGSSQAPTGAISRPYFLPSETGRRVLVFTFGSTITSEMMSQDLETGRRVFLGPGDRPSYSRTGHLVYQPARNVYDLWAVPFSLETSKPTGKPFPIAQNGRQPTIAADGTLVYLDGNSRGHYQLIWMDRAGKKVEEIGQPQQVVYQAALSPDGGRVAVSVQEGVDVDVWVWDLARGAKTRVSTSSRDQFRPVWSSGGDAVAFDSRRAGDRDVSVRQADGSGEEQQLLASPEVERVSDWSRDDKYIFYERTDPETKKDLWYLEHSKDGGGWEPRAFLEESGDQEAAKLSPDGRYLAYASDESGQVEVYVQPFPNGGHKVTVSNNGGHQARWSPDGKELFYVEDEKLMVVGVSTEGEFSATPPAMLFEHPVLRRAANYPRYDVGPEGLKFLLGLPVRDESDRRKIHVVQNWFAEFKDRERD